MLRLAHSNRRLATDDERTAQTSEPLMALAAIRLLLRRRAIAAAPSAHGQTRSKRLADREHDLAPRMSV